MKFWKLTSEADSQVAESFKSMRAEIEKVGGMLQFDVERFSDGWNAQCRQIPAILTGGKNPNPTEREIDEAIREAVNTAFQIPATATQLLQEELQMPKKSVRTLELANA